jgi:hypothetical protein
VTATEGSADQDALYVLTAVLLTPAQFPTVLGDDYPQACAALRLAPDAGGYGLIFGQDGKGARWTVAVDDVSLVAVAISSWDCGMEYDLSPEERTVVTALPGWPLALAVAAPGVPDPHDPDPPEPDRQSADEPGGEGGPAEAHEPLVPPDADAWGPAQRRLGADEVAVQWPAWRERFDAENGDASEAEDEAGPETGPEAEEEPASGEDAPGDDQDPGTARSAAQPTAVAAPEGPDQQGRFHPGVHYVLGELRGYLEKAPPLGRVRSSFAPEGARTLRADGPGWSFVARTDDMAFVLLDDEPGEVLPVGRGSELPGLLSALDAMAVRPV